MLHREYFYVVLISWLDGDNAGLVEFDTREDAEAYCAAHDISIYAILRRVRLYIDA